jgi:hypothetical protein
LQHDGRYRDRRARREPLLDALKRRVTWRVAEAVPVGLDDDVDEIRIVERRRWALEGRIVEFPGRLYGCRARLLQAEA